MSFDVVVRTRSTFNDYAWIGADPEEWWGSGWGSGLLRRQPSLLREPQESGRVLLSGVQSGRFDAAQTRIRYELAFWPAEAGAVSAEGTARLVQAWWADRARGATEAWDLGNRLDGALAAQASTSGTTVDALLEERNALPLTASIIAVCADLATSLNEAERAANQTESSVGQRTNGADDEGGSPSLSPRLPDPGQTAWVGAEWPGVPALLASSLGIAYFDAISVPVEGGPAPACPAGVVPIIAGDDSPHFRPKSDAPEPKPTPGQALGPTRWKLSSSCLPTAAIVLGLMTTTVIGLTLLRELLGYLVT